MAKQKNMDQEQVSNAGSVYIGTSEPYTVNVILEGVCSLLFHKWDCDAVQTKASAAKNSTAKKLDDLESYVYRDAAGSLCLPGEYLRQSVINAAKFEQDPRSPRKSAMDLFKAGLVSLTELASLHKPTWDFEDRRRAVIQRAGVTRIRPALVAGWRAEVQLMIQTPDLIEPNKLRRVVDNAGRLIGVGDFRPTYGRFSVVGWNLR